MSGERNETEKPRRLGAVLIVPGAEWVTGKAAQDRAWAKLRNNWRKHSVDYDLINEPVESTEFDEEGRIVRLEIRADGWLT